MQTALTLGEVLAGRGRRVSLRTGETLFREGDDSQAVYVCLDGRLNLTMLTPSGRELILGAKVPLQVCSASCPFSTTDRARPPRLPCSRPPSPSSVARSSSTNCPARRTSPSTFCASLPPISASRISERCRGHRTILRSASPTCSLSCPTSSDATGRVGADRVAGEPGRACRLGGLHT